MFDDRPDAGERLAERLREEGIDRLDGSGEYIDTERERAADTAREKEETDREGDPTPIEGRRVVLDEPATFRDVGQFYRDFGRVTDEEARADLRRASWIRGDRSETPPLRRHELSLGRSTTCPV